MAAKRTSAEYAAQLENFREQRYEMGKQILGNFMYIKQQLADWYIALSAVCFAIGAVTISVGADKSIQAGIVHHELFWWGAFLLIFDGVLIFFVRKLELESESSGLSKLRDRDADLWTLVKITQDFVTGDMSREGEYNKIVERVTNEYTDQHQSQNWRSWMSFVVYACFIDIAFGIFLFAIAMLLSQLLPEIHMEFDLYEFLFSLAIVAYSALTVRGAVKAVREKQAALRAGQRIQHEIIH